MTANKSASTWVTTGHKRNLRGAQTYGSPSSQAYKDNYDRIFGPKPIPGECKHDYKAEETGQLLTACRHCQRPLTMDAR